MRSFWICYVSWFWPCIFIIGRSIEAYVIRQLFIQTCYTRFFMPAYHACGSPYSLHIGDTLSICYDVSINENIKLSVHMVHACTSCPESQLWIPVIHIDRLYSVSGVYHYSHLLIYCYYNNICQSPYLRFIYVLNPVLFHQPYIHTLFPLVNSPILGIPSVTSPMFQPVSCVKIAWTIADYITRFTLKLTDLF